MIKPLVENWLSYKICNRNRSLSFLNYGYYSIPCAQILPQDFSFCTPFFWWPPLFLRQKVSCEASLSTQARAWHLYLYGSNLRESHVCLRFTLLFSIPNLVLLISIQPVICARKRNIMLFSPRKKECNHSILPFFL